MNVETTMSTGKERKAKYVTAKNIDAGIAALQDLADMPAENRINRMTERSVINSWITKIIELENKGHTLRKIHEHLRKKMKLRLSFESFRSYVSSAAKEKGITRKAKPGRRPAPVVTDPAESGWACDSCAESAKRTEQNGRAWWQCFSCNTLYADDRGKLSQIRLQPKS